MIVLDTRALLTREIFIDHAVSEIRFLSLQLAQGVGARLR